MAIAPARPVVPVQRERGARPAPPAGPTSRVPLVGIALALGVGTALSRLPFRSHYLFSWDSANFALALDRYNVAFHQPQPPGYPLYVGTAVLARRWIGDANASYVALSVVASGLAVFFLTLAAGRIAGRSVAVLAAVLLATSSVFWSQGEVAYPYAFLALFTSLVAWICAAVQDGVPRAGTLTVVVGGVIGVGAGFRSELLPFLAPLWVYAALRRPARWNERIATLGGGSVLLALVVLAWYVPMVQLSGGWAAYQAATGSYYTYFLQTTSGAGKLLVGLLENSRAVVGFLYNGLGLALVPMLYFLGRYFAPPRILVERRVRFLILWILPPVSFYVTVHVGNPGYVLSFLPALCIYAAEATLGLLEDCRVAAGMLAQRYRRLAPLAGRRWVLPAAFGAVIVIGASNALLFLLGNGEGRYTEIRQIDRILSRQVAAIRRGYPAETSLLIAYDRSRQYRYYLPQHRVELLFDVAVAGAVTDTSRYWERRTQLIVPPGVTAILFPDLNRNTSDQPGAVQRIDLGDGVDLYVARVQAGDEVRYGYQYASVQGR
ncbi:MAG: DUF2723 domain-containing protein [Chloroflexota bacterium]|nr:DUF2723 domain-containing protein [Chloroflexota bacterium]